jgi:hypothetical protein
MKRNSNVNQRQILGYRQRSPVIPASAPNPPLTNPRPFIVVAFNAFFKALRMRLRLPQ